MTPTALQPGCGSYDLKVCGSCSAEKPLEDFAQRSGARDGRRNQCRACIREAMSGWRATHRGEINAYAKQWHQEHPEKGVEYTRRYVERHPEVRKRYAEANRDRASARARAWVKANPQRHYEHNRARKRKLTPADADTLAFRNILARDRCSYCGDEVTDVDHIESVSTGGENHWTNLTGACMSCNRTKATKPLLAFLGGRR